MSRKKQSPSKRAPTDAEVSRVSVARPGDVVFIETSKPLQTRALQHICARFQASNLGVKVVVLQHGNTVAAIQQQETLGDRLRQENAG